MADPLWGGHDPSTGWPDPRRDKVGGGGCAARRAPLRPGLTRRLRDPSRGLVRTGFTQQLRKQCSGGTMREEV